MAYSNDSKSFPSSAESAKDAVEEVVQAETPRIARRELARLTAGAAGLLAAEAMLPTSWLLPVVHAATMPPPGVGSRPGGGAAIDIRNLPPGVVNGTNTLPPPTGTAGMPAAGQGGAGGEGGMGGASGAGGEGGMGGSAGSDGTQGADSFPDGDAPGNGDPCATAPTSPPAAPSGVSASPHSPTSLAVSWQPPSGVNDFIVEVTGTDTNVSQRVVGDSIVIGGLHPCRNYQVRVRSVNCGMESSNSPTEYCTTPPDLTRAPDGLTLTQLSCTAASFRFAQLPCVSTYEVQVSKDGVNWTTATFSNSSFTLYYLCPNTTYYVRMRGQYVEATTPWSTTVSFTTLQSNGYPGCECSSGSAGSGGGGSYGGPSQDL